ncbi:MAG: beta-propeller domain-containing protein [Usitatibacter sp.]
MTSNRVFLAIAALVFSAMSAAATVAERSAFAQGHWWNPQRSGSGFEIFSAAGQVAVVWYTFDTGGKPVWYTAQGDASSLGAQAWPLMQHRWSGSGIAASTAVGSLKLEIVHPEAMNATWELNGAHGTWAIEPLVFSGIINEVDHSGSWFDPTNSGWGLTVAEQGDVLGGAIFTYDASGAPTWFAGYQRASTTVEYFACTGACPACDYTSTVTRSAGTLGFEFAAENQLTIRNNLSVPMAPGVKVDAAHLIPLSRPASTRPADRQLANFADDAALKAYLGAGLQNLTFSLGTDFSPAPPAAAYSTTNLQETGVDEADLVKSDGQSIYAFAYAGDPAATRLPAIRVAHVTGEGEGLDIRGTVALASGPSSPMANAGLYLAGDKLVSVSGTQVLYYGGWAWGYPGSWQQGTTNIEILSTSSAGLPATVWRAQIDGHIVSSRRIGDRLYVVTRFVPFLQGFVSGATIPATVASNQEILRITPLSGLLPSMRVNGGASTPLVQTSAIYLPPQGARKPVADMVTVTAIDLVSPRVAQTLAILGTTDTIYASTGNLFLASSRQPLRNAVGSLLPEPAFYLTDIHQVQLGTAAMAIVGSASLEGFFGTDPDAQPFRMSEYQGRLRAVTSTTGIMWGGVNKNRLTVLEPSVSAPGLLRTVSILPNAQRPDPLGKPNELLYGTRFVDDRLYAVTFKKVDPLYVVDLANASDPRIVGALEIPGFSEYLHPLPNGLLLGFGKDSLPADTVGDANFVWYQGLQLTLFDVGNVGAPREIQRVVMGKRGSDSALMRDHHAFSFLTLSDGVASIAFPASLHDGVPQGVGPSAYYPWQSSGLMRFELHGTTAADARLQQVPALVTHQMPQAAPSPDPGVDGGRSVLFAKGTVYVGRGQFWRRDAAGNVSGPI